METIKDILKTLLKDLKVKEKAAWRNNPEALLKKAFSKKEQQHIKFNYFKKDIIGLKVDSSTWQYILNLQKEDLLTKLRKISPTIKDIRFRLGEIK